MKIRSIKPEFFSDRKIIGLSFGARLLFIGLWCHADDYGRGLWLLKRIEGEVFPDDSVDIEDLGSELVSAGLVRLYETRDGTAFFIPSWEEHQKPRHRAKTNVEPPPADLEVGQEPENRSTDRPGKLSSDSEEKLPGFRENTLQGEGEGEGEGGGDIAPPPPAPARRVDPLWEVLVELFGEPAPNHRGLWNRVRNYLEKRGATPDDVRYRAGRIVEEWGIKAGTITSLEKHWTRYDAEVGRLSPRDLENYRRRREKEDRRRRFVDREDEES